MKACFTAAAWYSCLSLLWLSLLWLSCNCDNRPTILTHASVAFNDSCLLVGGSAFNCLVAQLHKQQQVFRSERRTPACRRSCFWLEYYIPHASCSDSRSTATSKLVLNIIDCLCLLPLVYELPTCLCLHIMFRLGPCDQHAALIIQ